MAAPGKIAELLALLERDELPSPLGRQGLPSSPCLEREPVRAAPLSRVQPVAAAWAAQDRELIAEIVALEAAGVVTVPDEDELAGLALDPETAPPDGVHGWFADLPGPLLDEYFAAAAEVSGLDVPRAGHRDRVGSEGAGFAAGGVAEMLSPGAALAGLAEDAHSCGAEQVDRRRTGRGDPRRASAVVVGQRTGTGGGG